MASLAKAVDKFVAGHEKERMAAFVVYLAANDKENQDKLTTLAEEHKLSIPLTLPADGKDPGALKLNKEVPLTVLVFRNKKVAANFALTDPAPADEKAQAQETEAVLAAASAMLESK